MGARQHAGADFDRAHGARVAAVDARLALQDLVAHDLGFLLEQQTVELDVVKRHALVLQCLLDGGRGLAQRLGTGLLATNLIGRAELRLGQRAHFLDEGFVLGFRRPGAVVGPQRLSGFAHQLVNGVDGDLALVVAKHHGAQHHVFGQLVGFGFDHQNGAFSAGNDQIQRAALARGGAGVQHVFAVNITHAGRADGAVERNAADRQRRAHADHGGDVGIDLGVQRQRVDDDVHFVEEAVGKQRADRAVDQARCERLQLARLGFALEEAAGNLAGGVRFLDVVDGEREEILPRLGRLAGGHGGQDDGAVDVDQHGAGGLAGDFARFHDDGLVAPLEGLGDFVEQTHRLLLV